MTHISQFMVHHENHKDDYRYDHKLPNRTKIRLDVLMSFCSCETVPTELLIATRAGHYRTSSCFENNDPAYRTWLTKDNLLQIGKVFVISAEWIEVDLSVMYWIVPLSLTAFTFKRILTLVKIDWSCIMAFRVRTFSNIGCFWAIKLSEFVHEKCLVFWSDTS